MPYRSPYEAYPFLSDPENDLRCDYEILTDTIASQIGLLRSLCPEFKQQLTDFCTFVYHSNASVRTKNSINENDIQATLKAAGDLQKQTEHLYNRFVLPVGSQRACLAHCLRTQTKAAVRMLYRLLQRGNEVDTILIDFFSLLSNYFFHLALLLNHLDNVQEVLFKSRNYREDM